MHCCLLAIHVNNFQTMFAYHFFYSSIPQNDTFATTGSCSWYLGAAKVYTNMSFSLKWFQITIYPLKLLRTKKHLTKLNIGRRTQYFFKILLSLVAWKGQIKHPDVEQIFQPVSSGIPHFHAHFFALLNFKNIHCL